MLYFTGKHVIDIRILQLSIILFITVELQLNMSDVGTWLCISCGYQNASLASCCLECGDPQSRMITEDCEVHGMVEVVLTDPDLETRRDDNEWHVLNYQTGDRYLVTQKYFNTNYHTEIMLLELQGRVVSLGIKGVVSLCSPSCKQVDEKAISTYTIGSVQLATVDELLDVVMGRGKAGIQLANRQPRSYSRSPINRSPPRVVAVANQTSPRLGDFSSQIPLNQLSRSERRIRRRELLHQLHELDMFDKAEGSYPFSNYTSGVSDVADGRADSISVLLTSPEAEIPPPRGIESSSSSLMASLRTHAVSHIMKPVSISKSLPMSPCPPGAPIVAPVVPSLPMRSVESPRRKFTSPVPSESGWVSAQDYRRYSTTGSDIY